VKLRALPVAVAADALISGCCASSSIAPPGGVSGPGAARVAISTVKSHMESARELGAGWSMNTGPVATRFPLPDPGADPSMTRAEACWDRWVSLGGDTQFNETASTGVSTNPGGTAPHYAFFIEQAGSAASESISVLRERLRAQVAACPNGHIYYPAAFLGFVLEHSGPQGTLPGPSLGLAGEIDGVTGSDARGPWLCYSFLKHGIFATITIIGGRSLQLDEGLLRSAASRL